MDCVNLTNVRIYLVCHGKFLNLSNTFVKHYVRVNEIPNYVVYRNMLSLFYCIVISVLCGRHNFSERKVKFCEVSRFHILSKYKFGRDKIIVV